MEHVWKGKRNIEGDFVLWLSKKGCKIQEKIFFEYQTFLFSV
jgi:hypothetical protein